MAKDGTVRGSARPKNDPRPQEKRDVEPGFMGFSDMELSDDLTARNIPPIDDFLLKTQKYGSFAMRSR